MSEHVSERRAIAERIADFVCDNELAQIFGGDVNGSGRFYSIGLSVARYLDGEVRVYSPRFILVRLAGAMVGGEGSGVYTSVEDALAYLQALLVDHDEEAAAAIPVKPSHK